MTFTVLQFADRKVGGMPRQQVSGLVATDARAREIIGQNHTVAQALGYTSVKDGANNWVRYTAPFNPSVEITQYFLPVGDFYDQPFHPMTGPPPQFAPVAPPVIGASTEIVNINGQSNADMSGSGRFSAIHLPGRETWAFGEDGNFYRLSDPLGNGAGGQSDAGPWARVADRAWGFPNANGFNINRWIAISRPVGGTNIAYWANADFFAGSSTANLLTDTGSRTFPTQPGLTFIAGDQIRATSNSTGEWMQGGITSYAGSTMIANMTSNSGIGTHNDWTIRYVGAGDGFAYARAQLLLAQEADPPLIPTRHVFAQGEGDSAFVASWAEADARQAKWQAGLLAFEAGLRSAPFFSSAPLYVAETSICRLRTGDFTSGPEYDAIFNTTPDTYVGRMMAEEAVVRAQRAVVDGVSKRRGAVIDLIGPELRRDGCHLNERGNDKLARLWAERFYGPGAAA